MQFGSQTTLCTLCGKPSSPEAGICWNCGTSINPFHAIHVNLDMDSQAPLGVYSRSGNAEGAVPKAISNAPIVREIESRMRRAEVDLIIRATREWIKSTPYRP